MAGQLRLSKDMYEHICRVLISDQIWVSEPPMIRFKAMFDRITDLLPVETDSDNWPRTTAV